MQHSLLCVDDDSDTIELIRMMFTLKGFQVTAAMTSEECLNCLGNNSFDLIILDYQLPDKTGLQLCKEIRLFNSQTPIIFLSATASERESTKCLAAGAQAYLLKPDDITRIDGVVMGYLTNRTTVG
jgi:DNA-binding response OmpR family regulator